MSSSSNDGDDGLAGWKPYDTDLAVDEGLAWQDQMRAQPPSKERGLEDKEFFTYFVTGPSDKRGKYNALCRLKGFRFLGADSKADPWWVSFFGTVAAVKTAFGLTLVESSAAQGQLTLEGGEDPTYEHTFESGPYAGLTLDWFKVLAKATMKAVAPRDPDDFPPKEFHPIGTIDSATIPSNFTKSSQMCSDPKARLLPYIIWDTVLQAEHTQWKKDIKEGVKGQVFLEVCGDALQAVTDNWDLLVKRQKVFQDSDINSHGAEVQLFAQLAAGLEKTQITRVVTTSNSYDTFVQHLDVIANALPRNSVVNCSFAYSMHKVASCIHLKSKTLLSQQQLDAQVSSRLDLLRHVLARAAYRGILFVFAMDNHCRWLADNLLGWAKGAREDISVWNEREFVAVPAREMLQIGAGVTLETSRLPVMTFMTDYVVTVTGLSTTGDAANSVLQHGRGAPVPMFGGLVATARLVEKRDVIKIEVTGCMKIKAGTSRYGEPSGLFEDSIFEESGFYITEGSCSYSTAMVSAVLLMLMSYVNFSKHPIDELRQYHRSNGTCMAEFLILWNFLIGRSNGPAKQIPRFLKSNTKKKGRDLAPGAESTPTLNNAHATEDALVTPNTLRRVCSEYVAERGNQGADRVDALVERAQHGHGLTRQELPIGLANALFPGRSDLSIRRSLVTK